MNVPDDALDKSALLIIDMISDFRFADGGRLLVEAEKAVEAMRRARALFRSHDLPVVYVNDNFDKWNMGFSELVDWASRGSSPGRPIVDRMLPAEDDYYILKPRHSAFYETALPSLLAKLGTRRLAIVGVAGDSCVLSSALDAHIRKLPVWVPSNATASLTAERNERAMQFLSESLGCEISPVGG